MKGIDVTDEYRQMMHKIYMSWSDEPHVWQARSKRLWKASELLRNRSGPSDGSAEGNHEPISIGFELQAVYLMLVSFAVENALKALYFAKRKSARENGNKPKEISKEIRIHNLVHLWKLAELEESEKHNDLLCRLTVFSSRGRYPVALDAKGMEKWRGVGSNTTPDFQEINSLWQCLRSELETACEENPD